MSAPSELALNGKILDPFTIIIKLAMLYDKPIGTKLCILDNIVYIQEAGLFQFLVRYWNNDTKSDLQYLYNPIEYACREFLNPTILKKHPNIKHIFENAIEGLTHLMRTYHDNSIIILCLNYYINLIMNHMRDDYNKELFKKDNMSCYYTEEVIEKFSDRWTDDRLILAIRFNDYLFNKDTSVDSIKCLETFMLGIDVETKGIIKTLI